MTAIQKITCASLVLASLGGAPSWSAEVSRDFALGVNEANATLRGGDVDRALEKYASVQELAPESADVAYNMAVAQYRKGDIAAAEQLFQSAATSENDSLAANARYNLGNCNYASGLELSQKDRPAAIAQLESAIENYRSALDVDASNADARANIELASRLIDQLREEQQQQNEQQQNQQQDQQQQSSDQQQNNQQQNSQDPQQQDQQQNEQQNEQQDSQSSQSDNQQEQQDQQQSGSDQQQQENENQKRQEEQQSQQDRSQSDESKTDESQSDQTKSEEQQQQESQSESLRGEEGQPHDQQQQNQQSKQQRPQQQQPQDASAAEEAEEKEGEQPPQGELTAATEVEAKEGQDQKQVAMFDPSTDGEMTQQEAEKMLQAIRDRDMARRMQRRHDELRRHVPVDRDW